MELRKRKRFFIEADTPSSFCIGKITKILLGTRCKPNKSEYQMIKEWMGDNNIDIEYTEFDDKANLIKIK